MKENQVVNTYLSIDIGRELFKNYLSQESVYHTQWVYPHDLYKKHEHTCV